MVKTVAMTYKETPVKSLPTNQQFFTAKCPRSTNNVKALKVKIDVYIYAI